MHEINITVRNKVATRDGTDYVCGNSDYVVNFDFDEEWDAYETKTARFAYNGKSIDVIFDGAQCAVPVITNACFFLVGVFAGNLHTTTPVRVPCVKSILCGGGAPADPPESVYDQLMELIRGMGGASEEDIAKAVTAYLTEHPVEETDPTVPAWAKEASKPTYTAAEVGALSADTLQAATNAALAQAKASGAFDGADGDTGAQGPAGTTPVKGVDYWTAADKAEIVADVLAAGANIPDYVRTAAAAVAEKVLGVTGEATAAVSTGGSYTNRLPLSIDSSGAVYNTTGYKTGYRLNSSGAEKQITESYYDSSVCVTGFIPCTAGDVIRLAGLVIDPADTQAGVYNLAVYDSSFAKVDVASWKDVLTHASATTDSDGHISAITLSGKFGTAAVAYIRLSAKGVTADSIVTVNEEIGGGGTVMVDASRVPFNLAFLTDLHWNDDDAGRLEHAAGALSVIHEKAPLDAVVFGGDYIRNWSAVTAAEAREDISMCRECFAAAVDAPALWLRGNHDNNPYPGARLSKPEIFNRISRAQNTLRGFVSNPHDPYGCYGYMDFENARVRLVIVNTSDNDAFGMASLSGSYSALLDAYSISAAQLQWVADHALDFSDKASPEDWGLVFLSHAPIYSADSWSNTHTYTDSDGVAWTCNVVNLANLVKAYADKSSFSASLNGEIVSKDFSGLSSTAKVLCFVNGHKHALLSSSYNGFTFISCPNACNAGEKASADGTTYSKSAAGTAGETAFTALTIDSANSKVYAWVYGSGYDRTLTL